MNKKWKKLGLIFQPNPEYYWMKSYSWVPTAFNIEGSLFRVFFSGRNDDNLSETGYFDIDILNPKKILAISKCPVIERGSLGLFDDSLAVGCSLVRFEEKIYFYYVGWMQGSRVRYYPSIGLAISNDKGKTFKKQSKAPIIERSNDEPYGMASPYVIYEGGTWKMWYASYRKWELRESIPWPKYEIRYAESCDGVNWKTMNITCLGSEHEEAVARPWVIKEDGIYKMWFSYRKNYQTYRIGFASSKDGISWERRDDEVGIDVSRKGWDSEMLEYPCIVTHESSKYMFYNGNNFGQNGIGLAIYEGGL
jgi:predicted GH43/DUF377 family glycosyl hydrolase